MCLFLLDLAIGKFLKSQIILLGDGLKLLEGGLSFGFQDVALMTLFGQMQNIQATVTAIRLNSDNSVSLNVKYRLSDIYGAGLRDGQRPYIPGLSSMFILQHYLNTGNRDKYRPFVLNVNAFTYGKY